MNTPRALAFAAAALACALPGGALAASSPRAADSFTGHLSSARGHWRHDHAKLAIRLAPTGTAATRRLTVHLKGARCVSKKACLVLNGVLSGTITALAPRPSDGPRRFAIAASGTVTPLGRVHATGKAIAPGYIAGERVTLRLTLTDSRGGVTLTAASAVVAAFTSP